MDRSVATVGGVSVVLCSATVLHRVSLPTLQSDANKCKFMSLQQAVISVDLDCVYVCVLEVLCEPGHSLDLQPLFYAVGQGLLVVVFANSGQHSLLVGFVLVTAGIDLA